MNILVTGAKGMVGTALCNNLKNIRDGKNKTRPALNIEEIFEYDLNSTPKELDEYCQKADFVFNLAGVNRPENPEDFMKGNFGFASDLLNCLKKYGNKATIMLSSSIQATLAGRFGNSEYGRSKKAGEELFFQYAQETGAKVAVYRFVNLMGHSRPKYNSAVSTFCWAVANDEPFTVNDRSTELEVLYMGYLISLGIYSFKGVKVGLDCANGSSWNIAKSVFDALGADTYVINAQPNGTNMEHQSSRTEPEAEEKPDARPSVLAALEEKADKVEPVRPFKSYLDKDGDAR